MKNDKINDSIKLSSAFICKIKSHENGIFFLNEDAPCRLCLILLDEGVAIDVEDKLEYRYLETKSGLYITNKIIEEDLIGKRVALFAVNKSLSEIKDLETLNYIKEIIKEVSMGKRYKNANFVYCDRSFNELESNSRQPIKIIRKEKNKK